METVKGSRLLGDKVGASRALITTALSKAAGGVLLIDEAYQIMGGSSIENHPYATEVIDVLVSFITGEADQVGFSLS